MTNAIREGRPLCSVAAALAPLSAASAPIASDATPTRATAMAIDRREIRSRVAVICRSLAVDDLTLDEGHPGMVRWLRCLLWWQPDAVRTCQRRMRTRAPLTWYSDA